MKFITTAIIIMFFLSTEAIAFYCGNHIISKKDTAAEVLIKCGPPSASYSWDESSSHAHNAVNIEKDRTIAAHLSQRTKQSKYEEWIYNFGPNQFLYKLKFKNGKLIKIDTAGYGF